MCSAQHTPVLRILTARSGRPWKGKMELSRGSGEPAGAWQGCGLGVVHISGQKSFSKRLLRVQNRAPVREGWSAREFAGLLLGRLIFENGAPVREWCNFWMCVAFRTGCVYCASWHSSTCKIELPCERGGVRGSSRASSLTALSLKTGLPCESGAILGCASLSVKAVCTVHRGIPPNAKSSSRARGVEFTGVHGIPP